MSFRVVNEVLELGRAEYADRLVLLAIAEVAHHDGVGWLQQGPEDDRESIAWRAKVTERQVRRSIAALQADDELEVRRAQRSRRRLAIYRVIVGRLRDLPVDYDRLDHLDLDEPFWTPEELALGRRARLGEVDATTGQDVLSSEAVPGIDDRTSTPGRPDIFDRDDRTSATGHACVPFQTVPDLVQDSSFTGGVSKSETPPVSANANADAGDAKKEDRADLLLRAFGAAMGAWPTDRIEWGGWKRAFKPLADQGVSPIQLEQACKAYVLRWPAFGRSPFELTKVWALLSASLDSSYLSLRRWTTETSWRLPDDEVAWVLEQANERAAVDTDEYHRLLKLADETRRARADSDGELLVWVEKTGWALADDEWRRHVAAAPVKSETRRAAAARRRELRAAVAGLRFGRVA